MKYFFISFKQEAYLSGCLREDDPGRGGAVLGHHRRHQHQQRAGLPARQHRRRRRARHRLRLDPRKLRGRFTRVYSLQEISCICHLEF